MKTRIGVLSLGLLCALRSESAPLSTDLLVFVPKNVAQTVAGTVAGTYSFSQARLTIPGTFPINLENLNLDLNYQLKTLSLKDKGAFDTAFDFVKVRARASALHIDAVTEKLVNGIVVRVRIKVDCTNAVMENRAAILASGVGNVSQKPLSAKLDSLDWSTSGQDWMFSAEKCEGDTDTAAIESQINSFFSTSAELKKDVLDKTNVQIASWFDKNRNWSKQFPQLNSVVATRADEIIDNGKSWVLRLAVQMTPLMSCPSFDKEPTVAAPPTTPGPSGIELQMSSRVATLVAQCLHEMGHLYRRDLSSEMKGFKGFMESSLKKFIYWGDLLRFPAEAEFVFLSKTVGAFSFTPKEGKEKKNANGKTSTSILFEGQATVESQMKYIDGEKEPAPYVTFYTDVRGTMSLETQYSKASQPTQFIIEARGNPNSRLSYKWNVNTEILRDTGINTTAINDELMKTLGASNLQFELSPVEMTDTHQMNVVGVKMTGGLIRLQLQVNSKAPRSEANSVELFLSAEPPRSEEYPN